MRGSRDRVPVPAEPTRGAPTASGGAAGDRAAAGPGGSGRSRAGWQTPAYRVFALDCEITAYAPDDEPLF